MRTLALLLLAAPLFAQSGQFENVQIKLTPLAGSVYLLEGAGGNIAVSAGDDGVLMVDTQFAELAPKIRKALQTISTKPVRFVVNTHLHPDHVGGNASYSDTAVIVAHSNVRRRLSTGGTGGNGPGGGMSFQFDALPEAALPKITFDHELTLSANGEQIRLLHLPNGHTDGDILVFFPKANVVHMGDDFVRYGFPYIDLGVGGSVQGLITSIETALAAMPAGVKIIPGHGAVSTLDDMRAYLAMLKETSGAVSKALAAGKSVDDMKREKLLEPWKKWSGAFVDSDKWLYTLVNSLKAAR